MKLLNLKIQNFRRFETLNVDFHPELTVIVAKNGQGKTSILDAATMVLGTFVGAFDFGKAKHIEVKDARYHRLENSSVSEQVFPVRLEASLSCISQPIFRELNSSKGKTTIKGAALLTNYGKQLMEEVRDLNEVTLPLMSYYGSGRLWHSHKNMSRKSVLSESRTMGYEDCFTSASSFTQVQQWMAKATFAVIQQQSMDIYSGYNIGEQIKGIQETINKVLHNEGWTDFHYSMQHEELAMSHEELGVLPVSLLSDGVRAMVSMVVDMAWRCVKLNPHLGINAQEETPGIAFVDEIDMHLHPAWQQKIIGSLQQAFPEIQFIVTTHSPQVLSTVPAECIRIIKHSINPESNLVESFVEQPQQESLGVASSDVMAQLQGVDPIPDVEPVRWLKEYKTFIVQNELESDTAQELRGKILTHFGEKHQVWLECERLIRLQLMKAKLPSRKSIKDSNA